MSLMAGPKIALMIPYRGINDCLLKPLSCFYKHKNQCLGANLLST